MAASGTNFRKGNTMIAQTDHPYMLEWLAKAAYDGGGFISSLARAALVADEDHYLMVKPLMDIMRKRFPQYEPTPAVKKELEPVVSAWIKR